MRPPDKSPIGVEIAQVSKTLSQAFEQALADAGGSRPVWLILVALKRGQVGAQRQLAEGLGIREATLTHHLNGMERAGLITRQRDADNRRVHQVEITQDGEVAFHRLRHAAVAFDQGLREGIPEECLGELRETLRRLGDNARRQIDRGNR